MMFLRNHKSTLNRICIRLLFSVGLVTVAIRDYLFGNGLYIFRDWTWPLSTSLTPVANFSPDIIRNTGPDPLGFVRMFITWPIVVIDGLTKNAVLAEKAYVVYFFSVFIILFFILAELLVRLLDKESKIAITHGKRELFVLFAVLVCFLNFWSLEQLSDLYFTYVIEFALIGISVILSLAETGWLRATLLPGALLALCIFLDPDLYPYGLIAVTLAIAGEAIFRSSSSLRQLLRSLRRIPVVFAATLPALVTMLFIFSISTGTNLRTLDTFQASSGNLSLINALRLFGYWWSLIAYSPPSIITTGSLTSSMDSLGAPPYILLPLGGITTIWLISTWSVPTIAFGTTIFSHLRKLTLPVTAVAVVGLLFTQPSIFPFPYWLATELRSTPLIGGALVTFLALPDHALIIVASSFTILVAIGLYGLLTTDALGRFAKFSHVGTMLRIAKIGTANSRQMGVVLIVFLLLIFSGWQFFSGSFYPSGYIWGGSGNGVSTVGAFSPSQPPPGMVQVYDWLLSQPGDFNIYWPGPSGAAYPWSEKATGSIAFLDSPRPTVFPRALPYLISSNLTADIKDYLSALNVKYLVVQPFSSIAMQYDWGVGDVGSLNRILQSVQGISLVQNMGDMTVYQVEGPWGAVYSSPLVASYNASDSKYAIAYGVFTSLGTRIAITDLATPADQFCVDITRCSIDLISPAATAFQSSSKTGLETLNYTSTTWPDFTLRAGTSAPLPSPSNYWEVTNWGTRNATVGIDNGTMSWTFNHATTYLSLNYNGTVTNNNPGGLSIPHSQVVSTQVGFWYRTSSGFDGSLQIVIPQLNRTGTTIAEPVSPDFPPSVDWTFASFNVTLPTDAAYFTGRFAAQASTGSVEIRDAQIHIISLQKDTRAPFGFTMPLQQSIGLDLPNGYTFIEFEGNASLYINGQTFSLNSPGGLSWFSLPRQESSLAKLSGSGSIAAIVLSRNPLRLLSSYDNVGNQGNLSIALNATNTIVFTRPFALGYSLTSSLEAFSPHHTLDGLNLFLNVSPGNYAISFSQIGNAQTGYLVSLGIIFGIVLASSRDSLLRAFRSGPRPVYGNERSASARESVQVGRSSGLSS